MALVLIMHPSKMEAKEDVIFFDHSLSITKMYQKCMDFSHCTEISCTKDHECSSYSFNNIFFDIRCPFVMDSKVLAVNGENKNESKAKIRRNRKRKHQEMVLNCHLDQFDVMMEKALLLLKLSENSEKYFIQAPSNEDLLLNNISARTAAKIFESKFSNLITNTEKPVFSSTKINLDFPHTPTNFSNCLVEYDGKNSCIVKLNQIDYIIPPKSSFLLSDVNNLDILIQNNRKYDVILMDPPWENKSIKRKKNYPTLSEKDILSLPIPNLINDKKCLVFVWATNKSKLIDFVKNSLFKHWKIGYLTEWFWLKITKSGDPVVPLKLPNKKPYERIIVGGINCDKEEIPKNRIFVSVPSSISSHKPHIKDLVPDVFSNENSCLEIFSRSLNEGWTSVGNDVLAMQKLDYFTPTKNLTTIT